MKRKVIALLLALVSLFSLGICSSAYNGNNTVSPYYLYTSKAESKLSITNGVASCKSKLTGYVYLTTKIEATQYLEKKNGTSWETTIDRTWSDSTNSYILSMSNSKSNLSSGTYRLRTVFTVYSGTKSESIESLSDEITI